MAVSFTITRKTSLFHDIDGDNVQDAGELNFLDLDGDGLKGAGEDNYDQDEATVFDPGDHVYTRITITNTGSTNATGVTVEDTFFGSTLNGVVNVSPIAFDDNYTAIGNTVLRVGGAATINGGESTVVTGNLLNNDVGDIAGGAGLGPISADGVQGFRIDVVGDGTHAGGGVSANLGRYNIFADGSFNYVNDGTDTTLTTDSFFYTIRDKGLDGQYDTYDDLTSTAKVTITFALQGGVGSPAHRVWYVDSNAAAGGDGTSAKPFQNMSALNGAGGSGDVDATGEYIYVESGPPAVNPAIGPIELEAGQKLIGTGADLIVNSVTLATATATNSTLSAPGATVVTLAGSVGNNTIAGINIGNDTGTVGIAGNNFGTLTVNNAAIDVAGQALNLTTGTVAGTGFTSTKSDSGVQNVLTIDVNGTLALGTGTLIGATSNSLSVNGGNLVLTYGGDITNASATGAVVRASSGHSGSLTFTGTLTGNSGTGLQFDNADGTYNFNGTTNLNGGDAGIDILNGSTGTFTFGSSTAITHGGGGHAFVVSSSNANVTYSGTIVDNSGRAVSIEEHDGGNITFTATSDISANAAGAQGIHISGSNTSGTIAFNGEVTLSTQANNAVTLTSNTGKTINFVADDAGLDITTTSGKGFSATGGGTITVQGTSNTISSTTGTALEVQNTLIGAADLTFVSIGSNGGSNTGIILNATGSAGGLHVTGSGSAGSGGTIANKTGADGQTATGIGIYLNDTADVQLARMQLNDFQNFAIRGLQVNGFSLTDSVVNATGAAKNGTSNALDEGSISFGVANGTNGLIGTATLTNVTIHDGFENGFALFNSSGTVNLVMNNVDVSGAGNDGIVTQNFGTATVNIDVRNSEFSANVGDHFNATADNGANLHVLFGNNGANTLTGGAVGAQGQSITIQTGVGWSGTGSANISGNTITGAIDTPINVNIGGTGTFGATITNNTIGANGVAGSGTPVNGNKDAIRIVANGDKSVDATPDGGTLNALVSGNFIQQVSGRGIYVIGRDGGTLGDPIRLNVTIINNTFRQSLTSTGQAILLESGASSAPISDFVILHADIGGTAGRQNIFLDDWGVNSPDLIDRDEIRILNTIPNNRFLLTGYVGGATSEAQVEAYLTARNTFAAGGVVGSNLGVGNTWEGGGTPTQPISASEFAPLPAEAYEAAADEDEPADGGLVDTPEVVDGGGETAPAASGPILIDDGVLSQSELDFIVEAAIQRWAAAGATEAQIAAMRAVEVSVENLAGLLLGESGAGTIRVDHNAAGWSWFVDSTPGSDEEYAGSGTRLAAADGSSAAGTRIDLLTVLTHELGHQIGLGDLSAPGAFEELMYGTINAGERRLPGSDDLSFAGNGPVTGAFAFAPIALGTVPAQRIVVIEFRTTISAPAEDGMVGSFGGGAIVSSTETGAVLSVAESGNIDSLSLGNLVYTDVNKNGIFDGTDAGISGVSLTLYVDTNNDGVFDAGDKYVGYNDNNATPGYQQGVDTPALPGTGTPLTTTTIAGGLYAFTGLAPGDYIVVVAASNFGAGVLGTKQAHPGARDPDDADTDNDINNVLPGDLNVDGDNNAQQFLTGQPGTYAATRAITLAYGQEPTSAVGNDTNNTLDIGFDQPNLPPVIGALQGDSVSYTEDSTAVALDNGGNSTVTDSDSPDGNFGLGTLTVQITANRVDAEDVLLVQDGGNITVDLLNSKINYSNVEMATFTGGSNGAALVITFNDSATTARVEELLRLVAYRNSDLDSPITNARTVTWSLKDGDGTLNGGVDTGSVTSTINVLGDNDAPASTPPTASAIGWTEDASPVALMQGVVLSDIDAPASFAGGSLTINVSGGQGGINFRPGSKFSVDTGRLIFDDAGTPRDLGAISLIGTTNVAVTGLTAEATLARLNDLVDDFTFYINSNNPTAGDRTVTMTFNDGNNTGSGADVALTTVETQTLTVTAVNDAPTSTNLQDDVATFTEGGSTAQIDIGFDATLADDNANFNGGTLTVRVVNKVATEDQLFFSSAPASGITVGPGNTLFVDGIEIGTYGNGGVGVDRTFAFNANATPALVSRLLKNMYYNNTNTADPSTAQRTIEFKLVDGGGVANLGQDTMIVTTKVNVVGVDDAPVAVNDTASTPETSPVNIDVVGNDVEVDGPAKQVVEIAGTAVVAGDTVNLGGGATAKLETDGTITYNPNGKFNALTDNTSGAVNTSALETFTYKLAGGTATANVQVTVNGVVSPDDRLMGDAGNNTINGTPNRDIFLVQQGGNDTVNGNGGSDTFYFGGAFTALDTVDGGDGADAIILQGNYSAGVTFGSGTTSNISAVESISLAPGNITDYGDTANQNYSYNLTTIDANVPLGRVLRINGHHLRAGENLTFDGSLESDGRFFIFAGLGIDNLTGGDGNDIFVFGHDGRFGSTDVVHGGDGYDSIYLRGDYSLDFTAGGFGTITGVESITLGWAADDQFIIGGDGEFDYNIVWDDAMLADDARITVNGSGLAANETMVFNGADEVGGDFRLWGGASADTITGGGGDDLIYGGLGVDTLKGNGGADNYRYHEAAESVAGGFDTIQGFTHLVDKMDLDIIDANVNVAGDQAFSFIGSAAFSAPGTSAGQLRAFQINVVTNTWQIEGDIDGNGSVDFMVQVVVDPLQSLTAADFIL